MNQTGVPNTNYTANTNFDSGSIYNTAAYGGNTTSDESTNFDDEPPLLEGTNA